MHMKHTDLFADDGIFAPPAGSTEQQTLIEDEESIADEGYLDTVRSFSDVAEGIYPEVVAQAEAVFEALGHREPLRVLDIGSGVGLQSLALVRSGLPIRELILTDYSPKVLANARRLFEQELGPDAGVELSTAPFDLLGGRLADAFPGGLDLVVTCNTFMHFPDEECRRIIGEIRRLLRPRGVLIYQSHFRLLRKEWRTAIVEDQVARMEQEGSAELVEQARHHLTHFHQYPPLHRVYDWLGDAGFGYYECVFRKHIIGIFVAVA